MLNFEFLVCKRVLVNGDNSRTKSAANVLIFSLSKPLKICISIAVLELSKFTKRKTKLYTKTPHAVALLCWLVLPPKLSFQSPLRSKYL